MFAFSQILAGGQKVSEVTKILESEDTKTQKEVDEDEAILAFSNSLPGNEDEPKVIQLDEKAQLEQMAAQKELEQLNANDATSAFGVLA